MNIMNTKSYFLNKYLGKLKLTSFCHDANKGTLITSAICTDSHNMKSPYYDKEIHENYENIFVSNTFLNKKYEKYVLHEWQPNNKDGTIWPYLDIFNYGYSYSLELPLNYDQNKEYPLLIFLHGGIDINKTVEDFPSNFYMSDDDPYILLRPCKREVDWNPIKIQDVVEEVKHNWKIDTRRIYLSGLSMGGRGTFIVASELSYMFAAIMSLSPHDEPYNYNLVADNLPRIPILISHGKNDIISSYDKAKEMYNYLNSKNYEILFDDLNTTHCCWYSLYYRNSSKMNWLMSHSRICF